MYTQPNSKQWQGRPDTVLPTLGLIDTFSVLMVLINCHQRSGSSLALPRLISPLVARVRLLERERTFLVMNAEHRTIARDAGRTADRLNMRRCCDPL